MKDTTTPKKIMTVLDGKEVHYDETTKFHVQTRKEDRAWQDDYIITGNLVQAAMYYRGINVGPPYTKRLYVPSFVKKNQVLATLVGQYENPSFN